MSSSLESRGKGRVHGQPSKLGADIWGIPALVLVEPVEFWLLGPLEVRVGGRRVPVGGPKQQALVACLVLHANEVVDTDQLIAAMWDEPPKTATTIIQIYISRLRRVFVSRDGRDRAAAQVVTRQGGYLLRTAPEAIDLIRFRALVAEARASLASGSARVASERFREALDLWRGPALCGLGGEPLWAATSLPLEDLRIAAIEDRVLADLTLGKHAELVPELESLVSEHPLRERMRAQLMLALYRSGRQADALQAYQRTRRALVDQFGLEPGDELQRLHRAILAHDPGLELRPLQADPSGSPAP